MKNRSAQTVVPIIAIGRGNTKPVTTLYKFYALREMPQENNHCELVQCWLRRKEL